MGVGAGVTTDRGWSWMVVLGAAVSLFFMVGGMRSFGIVLVELSGRMTAGSLVGAVTMSLVGGIMALCSPLANYVGDRLSYRQVVFFGGLMLSLAFVAAAFIDTPVPVIVVFGLLTGVGYACIFSPCLVIVGFYFSKRRSLANGLAVAGGSVGSLCIPLILRTLLDTFGFRGGLCLLAALNLHILPASLLLRPILNPKSEDAAPPESTCRRLCSDICHWSLFRNYLFVFYVIGVCLGNSGYLNACLFLPSLATEFQLGQTRAAVLLSIVGGTDLVGRIFGGFLADCGFCSRSKLMAFCLMSTGLAAGLLVLSVSFWSLILMSAVLGLIGGFYIALMVVILIDYLGIERLSRAFSMSVMAQGIFNVIVPITLGKLAEKLSTFVVPFHICGCMMFIAGLCFLAEPLVRRLQDPPPPPPPPPRCNSPLNETPQLPD